MTREEMRERVRRLFFDHYDDRIKSTDEAADAVIAIIRGETLEEAAKECGLSSVGLHFAAAIRALKEGK